jgi:polyhydroxyalkanoate synthase subunit PhaC
MNSSQTENGGLLPQHSALQHERAPRPLPLFLELVREVSARDAKLASDALAGLRAYETAPRRERPAPKPEVARVGEAVLRDHGGHGSPVVLVPSLINPPRILDLDEEVSLTAAITSLGHRVLLVDWGPARARSEFGVAGHVEHLLLPLLRSMNQRATLIGYCLGGTMAVAAANLIDVARVITLAAPWNFSAYPESSHRALQDMWRHAERAARSLGALPMEVLQAAFWSLDPERTVRKFAEFGRLDLKSADARRFIELEEWANEGEPLPYPAAKELVEELFARDLPGNGGWTVGGRTVTDAVTTPTLHLTAERDLIAPPKTVALGNVVAIPSGHVGMIVGSARRQLLQALAAFLDAPCR